MRILAVLMISLLLLPLLATGQELLTRQMNLSEITDQAGTIVRGQVVDIAIEPHPNFPNILTLKVVLFVSESISGTDGQQISFRVYLPDGKFSKSAAKPGVRSDYRVGDELLLFLYPPSHYGLTSTVGGEQGRFRIVSDGQRKVVANSLGNRGLFDGVETQAQAKGVQLTANQKMLVRQKEARVEVQAFVDVVRQLVAGKKSR